MEWEEKRREISIHVQLKLYSLYLSISDSNWLQFFFSFTVEINFLKYFLDIGMASIMSYTYIVKHRELKLQLAL